MYMSTEEKGVSYENPVLTRAWRGAEREMQIPEVCWKGRCGSATRPEQGGGAGCIPLAQPGAVTSLSLLSPCSHR